ncbi:MAG: 16S rRNA (adenine(1518)-N(6)/adenine(1519)-N(6))-dimethyltransferase [Opitutaceae bacterium]|nr:16S rRNA (adenine(1518)-N(6)/adenine(1519)-N(6))-dimethyltransferase [Opitutaceae bacterium]
MPLTPSATRDLLARLGHAPKRFLGQNFLVDGNIVRKSLELAEVGNGDVVVEIGPGLGTLTTALLEAGATVWAVEKDRTLHAHLTETLLPRFLGRFHLLEGDAVEHPLAGLGAEAGLPQSQLWAGRPHPAENELTPKGMRGEGTPPTTDATATPAFKVVANLPYAIATPWLDAVLSGPLPLRMVLMLQQEAAQRYAAQPDSKSFGAISVFLQSAYDIAPGHKVAAACFHPRPDVESHLLNLRRKDAPYVFTAGAKAVIRSCFQQRRKQIGALLRDRLPGARERVRDILSAHGLTEQARPEAIAVDVWKELAVLCPPLA